MEVHAEPLLKTIKSTEKEYSEVVTGNLWSRPINRQIGNLREFVYVATVILTPARVEVGLLTALHATTSATPAGPAGPAGSGCE